MRRSLGDESTTNLSKSRRETAPDSSSMTPFFFERIRPHFYKAFPMTSRSITLRFLTSENLGEYQKPSLHPKNGS